MKTLLTGIFNISLVGLSLLSMSLGLSASAQIIPLQEEDLRTHLSSEFLEDEFEDQEKAMQPATSTTESSSEDRVSLSSNNNDFSLSFFSQVAMLSGKSKEEVAPQMPEWQFIPLTGETGNRDKSQFGYVFFRQTDAGPQIIISPRGTRSLSDMKTDLFTFQRPVSEIFLDTLTQQYKESVKIHSGFQATAESIIPSIREAFLEIKKEVSNFNQSQIYFSGHSLGGAASSLLALYLSSNKELAPNGVEHLVTFGAPSTGNETFVSLLDHQVKKQSHVVQGADPVVHLRAKMTSYALFNNRVIVPTQTNPHAMSAYIKGVDQHISGKGEGWLQRMTSYVAQRTFDTLNNATNSSTTHIVTFVTPLVLKGAVDGFRAISEKIRGYLSSAPEKAAYFSNLNFYKIAS